MAHLKAIWYKLTDTHTHKSPRWVYTLKYNMLLPLVHPSLLSRDFSVANNSSKGMPPRIPFLCQQSLHVYMTPSNLKSNLSLLLILSSTRNSFLLLLLSSAFMFFYLYPFSLGHHFHTVSPCSASPFHSLPTSLSPLLSLFLSLQSKHSSNSV